MTNTAALKGADGIARPKVPSIVSLHSGRVRSHVGVR
jgi:hypothetical protein